MRPHIFIAVLIYMLFTVLLQAQVKIGEEPEVIHPSSLLELQSKTKVLVLNRVNSTEMEAIKPLAGAMVYNTDAKTHYVFDGIQWQKTTASNELLFNTATNTLSLRDGNSVDLSSLVGGGISKEGVLDHIASAGQTTFTTPFLITDVDKVNVYRNGIRLNFTIFNSNAIQLESGVSCFANDAVKIIQFR